MSKKGTKALASATLMSLVLTTALSAGPVKAAAGQVTRTSGADRYATAAQVATSNWTTSDNVVLVSGEGYADAVSASALAKKLNAPILLTTAGSLSTDAANALTTLKAKNIYVVGGNASVSQAVRTQLKANYTLTELGGANRYETNAAVAEKLVELGVDPSNVMMVGGEGFSDALSVAPIAAAKGQILLLGLNDANYMSPVINFVQKHSSKVTVVGTKNVISDAIYSAVNAVNRVDGGQDRFDTNLKVLAAFKDTVKMDQLYVANASGNGYADALVASALAGKSAAPLVLVDGETAAATSNAVAYIKANATTKTDLNVIGGTGVVTDNTVANINNAVSPTTPTDGGKAQPGQAQVSSVTANSATTIQVKFAQAPADTSKIAFNVTREGTPVTLTTSWDSTNTVATLTYSSNLPEDTYAVDVKDGDNDLGSTNVSVTSQKIGKIVITSTALGVTAPTTVAGVTSDTGYATYKVLDQYGNDITSGSLAQGITWTCGIGNVDNTQTGILKVTPYNTGSNLLLTQYTTATLNGIDQTSGITTSANLTVTQSQGTLSDITLNKLYCTNNPSAVLTAGDSTDSFYIDYTATDLSGNTTNNYNLMKAGLMSSTGDSGNHITGLISSNPNALDVQLVTDPNNSNNALIQVTPQQSANVLADQPVVITAFTTNGKSTSITLNLKKAAVLDKLTLMAPSTTVAAGDTNVIIPFTAFDQNGAALTKYSDINNQVTLSGTLNPTLIQNPDGTASLSLDVPASFVQAPLTSQSATIQAVTKSSGKFSSLNISVQKAKTPNTLNVTNTQQVTNMETGAVQNLDFGYNYGDLAVKDQYGRVIDMSNQDLTGNYYYVQATTPTGSSVSVVTGHDKAYGHTNIQLKASGAAGSGSTTVTYTVMQHTASGEVPVTGVTPITQQYTVVGNTDIKDYTIDKVDTVYDAYGKDSNGNWKQSYLDSSKSAIGKFDPAPYVWGLLSGGGKVALAASDLINASTTNSDFTANITGDNGYDATNGNTALAEVTLWGNNVLNTTKTTSTATLTVSVKNPGDGLIHTATTTVNSKDDTPVAQSVGFYATQVLDSNPSANNYQTTGSTSVTVSGNNLKMNMGDFLNHVAGQYVTRYEADGSHVSYNTQWVSLYAKDQYGTPTAPFTTLYASQSRGGNVINTNLITPSNKLDQTASYQSGDIITITGVTANGLVDSVNITLTGTGSVTPVTPSVPAGVSSIISTIVGTSNLGTASYDSTTNTVTEATTIAGTTTLSTLAASVSAGALTTAINGGATTITLGSTPVDIVNSTSSQIKAAIAQAVLNDNTKTAADYANITYAQLKAYSAAGSLKVTVGGTAYTVVLN